MSGIDNYEYLIREALGENVDEDKVKTNLFSKDKYVVMRFFNFGEGVVDHIEGENFLKNHPMLIDYQLEVKPGDILKQPQYGRLRPGHFIIGGFGKENVENEADQIIETVKVIYR